MYVIAAVLAWKYIDINLPQRRISWKCKDLDLGPLMLPASWNTMHMAITATFDTKYIAYIHGPHFHLLQK